MKELIILFALPLCAATAGAQAERRIYTSNESSNVILTELSRVHKGGHYKA